jgi:YVTN family beta-propeller protein
VSAIRVADNAIVSRIPASSLPNRIVLTPDDARAYVSHNGSDVIAVIRTSDNAVETTFASPSSLGLGMSRDGARLYVTNHHVAGAVSVIRTADHGVEATVGVGDLPAHVEVTPDGSAAYVPNSGSGTVSVIRTADHAVVATIPVGGSPGFVAFAFVRSSLDEIDELRDAIGGLLATGGLNGGQAGALDNHLMNALRALERGQTSPAVAQLEAFIMQIQQFVADGVLTEAEVAPLIAAAKNAIAGLAA